MKRKDLIKELENNGWTLHSNGHDHDIYIKPGYRKLPVPRHREIEGWLLHEILKQAGLK